MALNFLILSIVVQLVVTTSIEDICIGERDHKTFPDPYSCDGFYQCLDEVPIHGRCPDGHMYDPELNICNWPENVDCHLSSTSIEQSTFTDESTETETTTTSKTISTPTPTEYSTKSSSSSAEDPITTVPTKPTTERRSNALPITQGTVEPGIDCPQLKKADGPLFLPSKIDCELYYLCYLGKPVPLHCLTGMHWNQLEYFCDDPFYAHCQVDPGADPNPFPDCPRRGQIFLPHKNDCQYFIFCNDGVGFLNRCPFYYGWDLEHKKCVLRSMARCYAEFRQCPEDSEQ